MILYLSVLALNGCQPDGTRAAEDFCKCMNKKDAFKDPNAKGAYCKAIVASKYPYAKISYIYHMDPRSNIHNESVYQIVRKYESIYDIFIKENCPDYLYYPPYNRLDSLK